MMEADQFNGWLKPRKVRITSAYPVMTADPKRAPDAASIAPVSSVSEEAAACIANPDQQQNSIRGAQQFSSNRRTGLQRSRRRRRRTSAHRLSADSAASGHAASTRTVSRLSRSRGKPSPDAHQPKELRMAQWCRYVPISVFQRSLTVFTASQIRRQNTAAPTPAGLPMRTSSRAYISVQNASTAMRTIAPATNTMTRSCSIISCRAAIFSNIIS